MHFCKFILLRAKKLLASAGIELRSPLETILRSGRFTTEQAGPANKNILIDIKIQGVSESRRPVSPGFGHFSLNLGKKCPKSGLLVQKPDFQPYYSLVFKCPVFGHCMSKY